MLRICVYLPLMHSKLTLIQDFLAFKSLVLSTYCIHFLSRQEIHPLWSSCWEYFTKIKSFLLMGNKCIVKYFIMSISYNMRLTIAWSCKLARNFRDILFAAFHEMWEFWKLIFLVNLFSCLINSSIIIDVYKT